MRERPRVLARDHHARRECLPLQLLRELDVVRANLLGELPVYPFRDPAGDGEENPEKGKALAALNRAGCSSSGSGYVG
jgi:hypothetical protein